MHVGYFYIFLLSVDFSENQLPQKRRKKKTFQEKHHNVN